MTDEEIKRLRKMGVRASQIRVMIELLRCCDGNPSINDIYQKMLDLEYYKKHGAFPEGVYLGNS